MYMAALWGYVYNYGVCRRLRLWLWRSDYGSSYGYIYSYDYTYGGECYAFFHVLRTIALTIPIEALCYARIKLVD